VSRKRPESCPPLQILSNYPAAPGESVDCVHNADTL
jgi:hypothetical protein